MQATRLDAAEVEVARERFKKWGLTHVRTIALGAYRFPPKPENIAAAKKAAEEAGAMPLVQRFDYGDEIGFSEWLKPLKPEELKARFAEWQKKKRGKVNFETPISDAATSASNPALFVDSMEFYEDTAIDYVASQAVEIPKAFGSEASASFINGVLGSVSALAVE